MLARQYIAYVVTIFSQVAIFAIFVRVILSWMRTPSYGGIVKIIYDITEPILGFFRRLVPPIGGMMDLSPIIAYFAIGLGRDIILRLLYL